MERVEPPAEGIRKERLRWALHIRLKCSFVLTFLIGGLFACGDDSPTSPARQVATTTIPGTATLVIESGETNQAIPGASVTIAGQKYETDENGRVTTKGTPARRSNIDIVAPGYLDRQTLFRDPNDLGFTQNSGEHRFTLWPATSPTGLDGTFTRTLLYTRSDGQVPLYRMRPQFQGARIVPEDALRRDERAMRSIREAAASMADVTGMPYVIGSRSEDPSNLLISMTVNPQDPLFNQPGYENAAAFVDIGYDWYTIANATIVFRTTEIARTSATLHELGHTLGLWHTPTRGDVMSNLPLPWSERAQEFSRRERLIIKLLFGRRPGNQFPDNDRQAKYWWGSSSGSSGHWIIACGDHSDVF